MKALFLKGLRAIAAIAIVWGISANFWNLSKSFGGLLPREEGETVTFERLFLPIRFALMKEGYKDRNLGYVSVRSVMGKPMDQRDGPRWSQIQYVAIPYILLPDPQGAPYVIGDYTGGDPRGEAPEGFVTLLDQGKGLVLYKKVAP